ncbi:7-cyano-7-deazaguanine synthase [Pseudomonadota bacterium]
MSIVLLASGGLDSTLSAVLAVEQGIEVHPLFVDYGQLAKERELNACRVNYKHFGIPEPKIVNVQGFGGLYPSGLTNNKMDVFEDAFLPGRNMLFLLTAATYACNVCATSISIGLLSEELSLFPDQTKGFLDKAQDLISMMTGRELQILAPLMDFTKRDVVALAEKKGVIGAYSCHAGGETPCGVCIACKEFDF